MLNSALLKSKSLAVVLLAVILAFVPAFCYAEDSGLSVYPLPAVFSSKNNSAQFKELVKNQRQVFIDEFINNFQQSFSDSVDAISDKTKYKTFVAYISIPRVSENIYYRGLNADIYLPLTASIYFVSMATGETLYSYPFTQYGKLETSREKLNEDNAEIIDGLYLSTYKDLVKKIIADAQKEFHPFSIDLNLIDEYKNLYVLDKGNTSGVVKGDLLSADNGNQLNVIFSDLEYAIAEKLSGNPKTNEVYNKKANGSIAQLKKPKVLFINDFNDDKIYNIFSTELGNNADFALISVNQTFYEMQDAVVSLNAEFSAQNSQNRTNPEYFLKLFISKPIHTTYPSNKDYAVLDKYAITVGGIIFDKSGKIIFAKSVNEEIKDETVADVKFSNEARFDILIKNAMISLTKAFSKDVKFKQGNLSISKADRQNIEIDDANGLLSFGDTVPVLRKVNTKQKEVFIPIFEFMVEGRNDKTAFASKMNAIIDDIGEVSKKDIILASSLSGGKKSNAYFEFSVSGDSALQGNEVVVGDFNNAALLALSNSLNIPVGISAEQFNNIVEELNSGGYGFKRKFAALSKNAPQKIKVAYKVNLLNEKPEKNLLMREYNITIGIKTFDDKQDLRREAMQQKIKVYVPSENNESIVQYELSNALSKLIEDVARRFNKN